MASALTYRLIAARTTAMQRSGRSAAASSAAAPSRRLARKLFLFCPLRLA